jgi:hypothetical protein
LNYHYSILTSKQNLFSDIYLEVADKSKELEILAQLNFPSINQWKSQANISDDNSYTLRYYTKLKESSYSIRYCYDPYYPYYINDMKFEIYTEKAVIYLFEDLTGINEQFLSDANIY